jgi:hypothetical protein
MADVIARCALCPRLCRSACPVAEGTGREAAVPARLAEVLLRHRRGEVSDALARAAVTLCVDCGGCQRFCHHGEPLPTALRAARAALGLAPPPTPLPVDAGGPDATVVVETDGRRWAAAWGRAHGVEVVALSSPEALSRDAAGHAEWSAHLAAVRQWMGRRPTVVADSRAAAVLDEAGVPWTWVDHAPVDAVEASSAPGMGGLPDARLLHVGAFGPFVERAPDDARRLAERWWHARGCPSYVADVGVANHLRGLLGVSVEDVVDRWLAGTEAR